MLAEVDEQSCKAARGAMLTHRLSKGTRIQLRLLLEDLYSGTLSERQFGYRFTGLNLEPAEGLSHLKWLVETYFELLVDPAEPISHLDARWSNQIDSPQQALSLIAIYLGELLPPLARSNLPIPANDLTTGSYNLPRASKAPGRPGN